jgi:hypothetical protein
MPDHPPEPWPGAGTPPSLLCVTMRVLWAMCLSLGAGISGIGIEMYTSGIGRALSYAVVVAGILFVPLSSALIERHFAEPASPE